MPDPQPVSLEIVAADACSEIFLIDGNFKLVKKGIGRETVSVPPGIYKIKNRSGQATVERMIVVREGMDPVRLDPVPLNSAMPLLVSTRTHEPHQEVARHAADAPGLTLGSGSAIVLVARQWTAPAPDGAAETVANPARGLSLHDMAGRLLADVEKLTLTQVKGTFDPCVSLDVALDPGPYRLSLLYANGRRVEQTLIASAGWQTQVYLLVDNNADKNAARVDLINGAITLRKPGDPFAPDDPRLREEEIFRGALRDSRKVLSDEIRSRIVSPSASPMQALLGAHLLIREMKAGKEESSAPEDAASASDNLGALRAIVANLRASLGRHPDVEAIASFAGIPDPSFVFEVPPMLRAGWPLLLDASVQRPASVPDDSLSAGVGERIWGEGPWLLWLAMGADDKVDRAALWQASAQELLTSLRAKVVDTAAEMAARALPPGTAASTGTLSALRKVKSIFTRRVRTPFPAVLAAAPEAVREVVLEAVEPQAPPDLRASGAALTDQQRKDLVKRLGVPLSRIDAWLRKSEK